MFRILILGKVWPEPTSSAAGSRMVQLIQTFTANGWRVSFASAARISEFTTDLASLGVDQHTIALNSHTFDSFVQQLNPHVVVFDRFTTEEQFGWRVAANCPQALRLLDTEDLHCLRAARALAVSQNRPFNLADLDLEVTKRELASIYRCDLSLIISAYEMTILRQHFKVDERLLHYIPLLPEPLRQQDIVNWPGFEARTGFMSIGNFLHEPNLDAVFFLKQAVWPLIRAGLPGATMRVWGAYAPQKVLNLHDAGSGFMVMGRAESAIDVTQSARMCLAPLRFGAGLKGKLVDAMLAGTPSVTTTIGAEAMHGDLPWAGLVADSPADVASGAITLYKDKNLWQTAQRHGQSILDTCFRKAEHQEALTARLVEAYENLGTHRQHNFTGAMLMHHTSQGTKYLSLWIAAKNKLKEMSQGL